MYWLINLHTNLLIDITITIFVLIAVWFLCVCCSEITHVFRACGHCCSIFCALFLSMKKNQFTYALSGITVDNPIAGYVLYQGILLESIIVMDSESENISGM